MLSVVSLTPSIASSAIYPCLIAIGKVSLDFGGLGRKINDEIIYLPPCRLLRPDGQALREFRRSEEGPLKARIFWRFFVCVSAHQACLHGTILNGIIAFKPSLLYHKWRFMLDIARGRLGFNKLRFIRLTIRLYSDLTLSRIPHFRHELRGEEVIFMAKEMEIIVEDNWHVLEPRGAAPGHTREIPEKDKIAEVMRQEIWCREP